MVMIIITTKEKIKLSIKDFSSKCDIYRSQFLTKFQA